MKTIIATTVLVLIISFTATIAQDKTKSSQKESVSTKMEMAKDSVYYTCSMHPKVRLDKPGKCPKCGMTLEKKTMKMTESKSKNMEATKTYTCSMHPDVKADNPGKCPKCGMALIEKK
jgi:rubrerythrin